MTENTKLLIVDDSKVSRMMIINIVKTRKPEWDLIEAASGEEALEKANVTDIDYFSIDLNMPGIDGLEVIEQLKSRYSPSRMVLMTANIQENIHDRANALGASHVHKPITEASIDKLLGYFSG